MPVVTRKNHGTVTRNREVFENNVEVAWVSRTSIIWIQKYLMSSNDWLIVTLASNGKLLIIVLLVLTWISVINYSDSSCFISANGTHTRHGVTWITQAGAGAPWDPEVSMSSQAKIILSSYPSLMSRLYQSHLLMIYSGIKLQTHVVLVQNEAGYRMSIQVLTTNRVPWLTANSRVSIYHLYPFK